MPPVRTGEPEPIVAPRVEPTPPPGGPKPPADPEPASEPVQPPPVDVTAKPTTQPANTANIHRNLSTTVTSDADVMLRSLTDRLQRQPTDPAAHLQLQLYKLLRNEQVPQLDAMASLPSDDREMVSTLLDAVSGYIDGVQREPGALPSKKVAPVLAAADRLREQVELTIPTIALCRRVQAFGNYEPMPLTFRAGVEHEAIIYCEVENFSSRLNDKGLWETKLSMEAVLYNSAGDAIMKGKDLVPTDLCRNRRKDFFVGKPLKLPATLAASRYILKVTIVDVQGNRVAENSLNIMMMAQ